MQPYNQTGSAETQLERLEASLKSLTIKAPPLNRVKATGDHLDRFSGAPYCRRESRDMVTDRIARIAVARHKAKSRIRRQHGHTVGESACSDTSRKRPNRLQHERLRKDVLCDLWEDKDPNWEIEALGSMLCDSLHVGSRTTSTIAEATSDLSGATRTFARPQQEQSFPYQYPAAEVLYGLDLCSQAKKMRGGVFPISMSVPVGWDGTRVYKAASKEELFQKVFPFVELCHFREDIYDTWIRWFEDNYGFAQLASTREDVKFVTIVEEWAERHGVQLEEVPGYPVSSWP